MIRMRLDRRWLVLAILSALQFLLTVDMTVVNVALPSIGRTLRLPPEQLVWVVNGYVLAAGGLLLLGGRLADALGRRRVFLAGVVVFGVASLASGLAPHGAMLIGGRVGQGIGEALAAPAALSIIALLFPGSTERAQALAIWAAVASVGSAAGVVLSGVIVDLAGWRWIFLVNVPVAVGTVVAGAWLVDPSERRPEPLDVPGAVLATAALGLLTLGLLFASEGTISTVAVAATSAGLVLLATFVAVERRAREPLVPLRFLASPVRRVGNLATAAMSGASFGVFFLLTLFLQREAGYTALQTGLAYLGFTVAILPGLAASSWLLAHIGRRRTLLAALALAALGLAHLSLVSADASYLLSALPGLAISAFGMGIGYPTAQEAALEGVSSDDAGLGSGIVATVRHVGGALGLAILVTAALTTAPGGPGQEAIGPAGTRLGLRVGAGLLLMSALAVAWFLRRDPDEAP
jgi:EmrB/QacA subfamily drug resistance transporter